MRLFSLSVIVLSFALLGGCNTPEPLDLHDQPSDIETTLEDDHKPTLKSEIPVTTDDEIVNQADNAF